MIDYSHRFHGRSSLRYVYQRGRTVRSPLLQLRYARNARRSTYRVAVVVSRKVNKSAVVRNRIRRRIYEIVRAQGQLIRGPYDLVFTATSDTLASLASQELQKTVLERLQEAGVASSQNRGTRNIHAIVKAEEQTD